MSAVTGTKDPVNPEVESRLVALRKEVRIGRRTARMSQQELASRVGRTQRWMSGVESGMFILRVTDAVAIAEILRPALGRNILEVLCDD